jgi:hypothetical protein
MPTSLLARCQPDCIREFRLSAKQRYNDGLALAAAGRRTGAIYVWGYVAEMILKAAYFSLTGLPDSSPITWTFNLKPAIMRGQVVFGIAWPNQGAGHNVRAWAELLVAEHALSAVPYALAFGLEVQRRGQRIGQLWRETLRYHKNFAYFHEVRQVREAVEWLLVNSDVL